MNRHLKALMDLVDLAEQRPLTEAEAGQLRTALRGYDAARRQLGAILTQRQREAA